PASAERDSSMVAPNSAISHQRRSAAATRNGSRHSDANRFVERARPLGRKLQASSPPPAVHEVSTPAAPSPPTAPPTTASTPAPPAAPSPQARPPRRRSSSSSVPARTNRHASSQLPSPFQPPAP